MLQRWFSQTHKKRPGLSKAGAFHHALFLLNRELTKVLARQYIRVYNEGNEMTDWSEMYPFNTNIWPSDKGEIDRMEYSYVPWG